MSQLTKTALAASLKRLINTKPLNKITIKDIADDCGVNRQTFYYHFTDIYDLIEWIFRQDFDNFFEKNNDVSSWKSWCLILVEYMKKNKVLILGTYDSISRRQLENHINLWLRPVITKVVEDLSEDKLKDEENKNFVISLYMHMVRGLILEWVELGMSDDLLKNIDKFFCCMEGSVKYISEKLSK